MSDHQESFSLLQSKFLELKFFARINEDTPEISCIDKASSILIDFIPINQTFPSIS